MYTQVCAFRVGALLLTMININPKMDKLSHTQ